MNKDIKTLQKLRLKEEKKYRIGFNLLHKSRKYLEQAKSLSFQRQKLDEQLFS